VARVLVVDADVTIRTLVEEVLHLDGCDVDLADGLEGALMRLGVERYDLVLTDTLGPPNGARDADLAQIKASAASTPIVLFTGFEEVAVLGAEHLGVAAVLLKPAHLDDLLTVVRAAMNKTLSTADWFGIPVAAGKTSR
jgi:DNA-binding NtrC family response regulator